MPQWLIKLFHSLGRKSAAKRTGIAEIPTTMSAEGHGAALYTQLREAGFTDEALTKLIKSEKDIIRLVNKVESMQNQRLRNIERKFFDPSGKMKKEGQDIVKKGLEGLGKKKDVPDWTKGWTPKIVPKETDAQIKARMIKENRRNVQKSYLRQLDEKILKVEEGFLTKADLDNMSPDALDSLRRNVDPHGMHKHFGSEEIGKIDDFASGGIARVGMFTGGPIVKGGKWVIKNLKNAVKEVDQGKGPFSKLNPMQQGLLKNELNTLIKQLERGGPIPDEMLTTMRQDKRFKDVVKTPSTDPELREIEEVLLDHEAINRAKNIAEKNLKAMEQEQILEKFDVTGKTKHASGGIAGELHLNQGGRVSFVKGGKVSSGLAHVLGV